MWGNLQHSLACASPNLHSRVPCGEVNKGVNTEITTKDGTLTAQSKANQC